MTKRQRRTRSKKLTRHHIVPTSRKGTSLEDNLAMVPRKQHQDYHNLFSNRRPEEIIDYLIQDFWNGDQRWIDKYLEKYDKRNVT